MLEILKKGKEPVDKKKILKFKCKSCKCVFKTDEYQTKEDWIANNGRKRHYYINCPNCGKVVCQSKWVYTD